MRIVQIIDSLEAGGAERMAVNYANALADVCEFSGLVASRNEGSLKSVLSKNVAYLHLNRKSTIDISAISRLRKYCISNKVQYIHAHSSSYFVALLVKMILPKINIVWHDHNGMSEFLATRKVGFLKIASFFFSGIIVVNQQLLEWASSNLNCKNVIYLPNFTVQDVQVGSSKLSGFDGKRIVCLANLRPQKNHQMLLRVADRLRHSHPEWTFHLIGKDFNDAWSATLRSEISSRKLDSHVYLYGSRNDVDSILHQIEIGVLTSISEGLPVALLEYGMAGKAVVATSVGEISSVIDDGNNGFHVKPNDDDQFYDRLKTLIEDDQLRTRLANNLKVHVELNYSKEAVLSNYTNWLKHLWKTAN